MSNIQSFVFGNNASEFAGADNVIEGANTMRVQAVYEIDTELGEADVQLALVTNIPTGASESEAGAFFVARVVLTVGITEEHQFRISEESFALLDKMYDKQLEKQSALDELIDARIKLSQEDGVVLSRQKAEETITKADPSATVFYSDGSFNATGFGYINVNTNMFACFMSKAVNERSGRPYMQIHADRGVACESELALSMSNSRVGIKVNATNLIEAFRKSEGAEPSAVTEAKEEVKAPSGRKIIRR